MWAEVAAKMSAAPWMGTEMFGNRHGLGQMAGRDSQLGASSRDPPAS